MLILSDKVFHSVFDPAADVSILPPDFFEMDHSLWEEFALFLDDENPIGVARWYCRDSGVIFDFFVVIKDYQNRRVLFECAALLSNRLIARKHPVRLLYEGKDKETIIALKHNLFFPKGNVLQRLVEGYRYALRDSVFDPEGYIIHQGLTEVLPFGFFSSRDKGCGWIAAYNLLKMNGREKTIFEVADSIGSDDTLGELFGHSVYNLYRWLKKQGLNVHMTHMVKDLCVKKMEESACGIFLYFHKRGSHFVAYRKIEGKTFRFYNAVYGRIYMDLTVEDFMKQYTVSPVSNLIWMDQFQEL